jgi:hypothetical protein
LKVPSKLGVQLQGHTQVVQAVGLVDRRHGLERRRVGRRTQGIEHTAGKLAELSRAQLDREHAARTGAVGERDAAEANASLVLHLLHAEPGRERIR